MKFQKALQEFVLAEDRVAELHSLPERVYIQDKNAFFNDGRLGKQNRKLLSAALGLQKNLYFSLPGTQLSVDFFKEQVWGQCGMEQHHGCTYKHCTGHVCGMETGNEDIYI